MPNIDECEKINDNLKPEANRMKKINQKSTNKLQDVKSIVCTNEIKPPKAVHENFRSKTRKFQCENCGKSFHSKDNYNLHITIHVKRSHGNQICKVVLLTMLRKVIWIII